MMNGKAAMNGLWCTKDDVMQDLALAAGAGSAGALDVDERCLVYGERPPPRPAYHVDDDMKVLFGDRLGQGDSQDHKYVEPDLKGIMSMIRMVETEEEEHTSPKAKPTDIIVISKLNPNVREFIPKIHGNSVPETLKTDEKTTKNLLEQNDKQKRISPTLFDKETTQNTSTENKTSDSLSTEDEINILKEKILNKAKVKDCYEHRREKNAAIATLMRHCTTPPITNNVKAKPIKLYTPEFFERCKASDFIGTDDNSTELEIYKEQMKDTKTNENESMNKDVTEENIIIEHTNLTQDINNELNIDDAVSSFELSEQKKSIAKVNEWLDGPKSPKIVQKPMVHTGSISYKRKEVMSPSSNISATIDKKIPKQDIKAYVPSNYANELRMKYEKNKKETNKPLNIWDNLENELKKKDEEIKKKAREE